MIREFLLRLLVLSNPAGNVSAGVNASAADVVYAGRARLKGSFLTSTATAGTVDFLNSSPTGTSLMKISSVSDADATRDVVIPEEGVLFTDGIYIQYTVSTFLTMTVFHA
jgi:acyl-coenzyme A thioesterase PaaI-like protein